MTRVLVAVDESEGAEHAAQAARRLFGDDAHYLAVNVSSIRVDDPTAPWYGVAWGAGYPVPYGGVWSFAPGPVVPADREPGVEVPVGEARTTARTVADRAGLDEADVIGGLGDPADIIMRVAAEHDVDVIAVGAAEHGWLSRLWHRSVAHDVTKHATVPVLVVS